VPSQKGITVTKGKGLVRFWQGFHPTVRGGCRMRCRTLLDRLPLGAPPAAAPPCTLPAAGAELPARKREQDRDHSVSPLLKLRHGRQAELTPF